METKQKRRKVVVSLLALVGLLLLSLSGIAGNLEPSAPPGPTMKTLDEVEPRIPIPASATPTGMFIISQSGSYYLTGDRKASDTGIRVDVNDVTIDLAGYSLVGSGTGFSGIYMGGRSNVEIRDGTVRGFGSNGIRENSNGKNSRVIGIRAMSNGSDGVSLTGHSHLVKDCTAAKNGGKGIYAAGNGCTVTGNTVYNNNNIGINTGDGCTVTGNAVYDNNNVGIYVSSGCTVTGNTARSNQGKGIRVYHGCTVTGNTAYYNQNDGITAEQGCTITGNNAYLNNQSNLDIAGISVGTYCLVKGNTVCGNKQNNIYIESNGNAIEENLVTDSTGYGIYFNFTDNFYANNRASENSTADYGNTAGNTDGGGNASF